METLKFNYGQTPEDVIRERHGVAFTPNDLPDFSEPWARVLCVLPETSDLIILLDSLAYNATILDSYEPASEPAGVRRAILATLGIEER